MMAITRTRSIRSRRRGGGTLGLADQVLAQPAPAGPAPGGATALAAAAASATSGVGLVLGCATGRHLTAPPYDPAKEEQRAGGKQVHAPLAEDGGRQQRIARNGSPLSPAPWVSR